MFITSYNGSTVQHNKIREMKYLLIENKDFKSQIESDDRKIAKINKISIPDNI